MSSRPRRSAAVRAHEAISDLAGRDLHHGMSTRHRRSDGRPSGASVTRDPPSSPGNHHLNLTVKVPSEKLREATSGTGRSMNGTTNRDNFAGGEIVAGKRNRGAQKSYVIESESDMSDPGEEDDEMEVEEEEDGEEDAEGEDDDMDIDADGDEDEDDENAEGEEDADGDVDMEPTPSRHTTIKLHNPNAVKPTVRRPAAARVIEEDEDEDEDDEDDGDEELSEIEVSDPENGPERSINVGGASAGKVTAGDVGEEEDAEGEEEDAEGEEDDMELPDAEGDEDAEGGPDVAGAEADELDSDEEAGSRDHTPDLSKMTRRQRARFEDIPQEYMKLSDEVQVKKHFTAEELSMRRAEMARRRRNLSDKRNEEVKMETINKLLKKQAPKTKGKGQAAGDETLGGDGSRPDVVMVRWISSKEGVRVGVPREILEGPAGKVFVPGGLRSGKLVEEVK